MTPAEVEALRWAIRRAEQAEDRAARWIGWGRPSDRADEKAAHAAAFQRVHALRTLCDRLGVDQPPRAYGLPAIEPNPTPNLFDHQEVAR